MIDDPSELAKAIICEAFGIDPIQWEYNSFDRRWVENYLFLELHHVLTSGEANLYPEAAELLELYSEDFILEKCRRDAADMDFIMARMKVVHHLKSLDSEGQCLTRRHMIYGIHERLLAKDYGDFYNALDSDCEGVIREAAT